MVTSQCAKNSLGFSTWSGKIAYMKHGERAFLAFNLETMLETHRIKNVDFRDKLKEN